MSSPQPQVVAQQMTAEAPARISSDQPVCVDRCTSFFRALQPEYRKQESLRVPIRNPDMNLHGAE
ncbi:hypothetical protein CCMA1212_007351 [Trichoderma ghanense]|uniref:Uncharacterized protein n=1 Tax=Trichoderma ghanense TaxID=65468 RepID=A0ABY2GYL0_9HYPO